ncbi:hypothetical protein N9A71_05240 [Porticoccaceae bacterium]|nr:hypothetical protein [Porticoccaceae bacterium]
MLSESEVLKETSGKSSAIFIAVNYGTSELIDPWYHSIQLCFKQQCTLILVDNFSSDCERERVRKCCKALNVILIENANTGYGSALNLAYGWVLDKVDMLSEKLIFSGNLDIEYISIGSKLPGETAVFMPFLESKKKGDQNPFLTHFQKNVFPLFTLAAKFKSRNLLLLALLTSKILGIFPSRFYACHGSLFAFTGDLLSKHIFNNESFLYCEELEFAEYVNRKGVQFSPSEIFYRHTGKVSTGSFFVSKKSKFMNWVISYNNWCRRWS